MILNAILSFIFFFQLEMIGSALQNSNINLQGDQNNPMIITIQYKVYPDAQDGEPQKVFISRRIFWIHVF